MKNKVQSSSMFILGAVSAIAFLISCSSDNSSPTVNQAVAAAPTDQLICNLHYSYITTGGAFECLQASDTTSVKNLTLTEIYQAGWYAISVGGDGNNRSTMIFRKD